METSFLGGAVSAVRCTRSSAISLTGITWSTGTRAMALRGIPAYRAVSGSWTMAIPPCCLMLSSPAVPSLRLPDSRRPITRGP